MPPLLAIETWSERTERPIRARKGRCFIIAEGANTEYWYFSELAVLLARKNLPKLIELVPIQRTGDDTNNSHPKRLLEQAQRVKNGEVGVDFDSKLDKIIFIFDLDIYKGREPDYLHVLSELQGVGGVAITNPSFELYLLLHLEGSYETLIQPNHCEILQNGYAKDSRQRFIAKLANEAIGANLKKSKPAVRALAANYPVAISQEQKLNQDTALGVQLLTSNVGKVLDEIIHAE